MSAQEILLTVLTFAAAYAFLRRGLFLSPWGASLGAAFAAFCWPRFAYQVHIQLEFTAPIPLLFLLVLEALRDGLTLSRAAAAWRLVAAGLLIALILATALYLAVFAAIVVTVAAALALLHGRARRHLIDVVRLQWPGLLAGAISAAVLSLPVLLFYLPLIRESGGRSWEEVIPTLPHPLHYLWMGRENWVWGRFFAQFPAATSAALWPELRIGVGAVASLAWAAGVVWAALLFTRRRSLAVSLLSLTVLTGFVLQLLMLDLPGDRSAWWFVWRLYPGANGLRFVSRLELVVTLAMGAWFGYLLDQAIASRRLLLRGLATVLTVGCALEQFGSSDNFDGVRMAAFERAIADKLVAPCPAIYVVGTPDLRPPPPVYDPAAFDAAAYLAANPDVAAHWTGTAWEHYERFGRAEGRVWDARQTADRQLDELLGYNYTVPLAAVLAHKPVVNGLSGTVPRGWHLSAVLGPDPAIGLAEWLAFNRVPASSVCMVPIRITVDMLPIRSSGLWP